MHAAANRTRPLRALVAVLAVPLLLAGCAERPARVAPEEVRAIAEEAYVYAFPMLMGYRYGWATFLEPSLPTHKGPPNAIHGEAVTLDHEFKDVITPNADTPYSFALVDLRAEPVVLEVPEVADRYYVMQFVDLYGTNPHYVGTRTTGTAPGAYLLVGPRWNGEGGDGFDGVLRFETDLVFLIGRTQLLGPDDVDALAAIMAAYRMQPLSAYRGEPGPAAPETAWPAWDDAASRDERFVGYLNFLLGFCQPPHASETETMARFARIGIGPGMPFDAGKLDPATRTAIVEGVANARKAIEETIAGAGSKVNGWGTSEMLGSREFFAGNYVLRAAGAMMGWGGNDKAEAFYPVAREDSEGRPFDGANRYRLKLASPPPAKAFWSVTMYDTSYDGTAGYLVENPIGRYLINSTTRGLVLDRDGSLEIAIQHDAPEGAKERANWLPAPEGPFYLAMRLYQPEPAALDGTWSPPPVVRID